MKVSSVLLTALVVGEVLAASAGAQTTPLPSAARDVLQREDLHCIYEDEVGFVWLCSDEGLLRFDGHTTVQFGREAGPLRAALPTTDGRFWAGGASGLYEFVMAPEARRQPYFRRVTGPASAITINALIELRDRTIGCATDDGVKRAAGGRVEDVDVGLPLAPASRHVHTLLEDELRTLWVAATTGLYLRTADGRTARFTTRDGLPDDDIQALALDADGRLWAGSRTGLAVIYRGALERGEPGSVTVFTREHGLPSSDIRFLRRLGATLWIGTADGIAALRGFGGDGVDLDRVSPGFVARDIAVNPAGGVWVATGDGARVYPSEDRLPVRTVITAIRVDGKAESVPAAGLRRAHVDLPWNARLVEFEFVSPRAELDDQESRRTARWMMSGLYQVRSGIVADDDFWQQMRDMPPRSNHGSFTSFNLTSRRAVIPGGIFVPLPDDYWKPGRDPRSSMQPVPVVLRNSPPGRDPSQFAIRNIAHPDSTGWLRLPVAAERRAVIERPSRTLSTGPHRFIVAAITSATAINQPASVEFTVRLAPWVQWWFLGPAAVTLAGLVTAYRRTRVRQHREIERVRSRIAADLHDSVGASLSRIAILSEVATQQVEGQGSAAAPALNAIGENARAVIDEMSDAIWFIDPDIRDVRQMLVRVRTIAAALFEPDGIRCRVDASEDALKVRLSSDERRHIYLVVKEALTNARRHAQPSMVSVHVGVSNAGLRIEVEDDGAASHAGESRQSPPGNGIANMRTRASELRGTLTIEPGASGQGTRVVLQTSLR